MCECVHFKIHSPIPISPLIGRGAPGRLMKLEDMQTLLEDFCIPLQLASTSTKKHTPTSKDTKDQVCVYMELCLSVTHDECDKVLTVIATS